ncbi:MAG: threonine/serine dehydratase [Anaerolineae bacterium]|nr:threonine/serine dehydratase [Anaerolineae bacterium]
MITLDDLYAARTRLQGISRHTPLLAWNGRYLKPESLQPIGSFKVRGAYNRIAAALEITPEATGVIAYSSGNHAQGVAYAAQRLGLSATIVMPHNAPEVKINATRAYGGQVVFYDPLTEQREAVVDRLREGQTWILVPPFDDPQVIAGQGTIGLEIFEDFPSVRQVIVPIGGGGLISGVSTALKSLNPAIKVIGVEPELAADAAESLQMGTIQSWTAAQTGRTIADGVRTLQLSHLTFDHIQHYVDQIVTVSEDAIRMAVRTLALEAKMVIEPSGAIPLAAWQSGRIEPHPETVLILSGGNIDSRVLIEILAG